MLVDVLVCLLAMLLETRGQGEYLWSRWSHWSECSATCGKDAVRTRQRICIFGSCPAAGPTEETKRCFEDDCCARSDKGWSVWSECSKVRGCTRQRERVECTTADLVHCPCGRQALTCTDPPDCCAPANWLPWEQWSECDQQCRRRRGRSCRSGFGQCVLVNCPGNAWDRESCRGGDCCDQVTWGQWGQWGSCSVTCGQGSSSRRRACQKAHCQCRGGKPVDSRECSKGCCQIPGLSEQGVWGPWSACSVTCGRGERSRTLHCGDLTRTATDDCVLDSCEGDEEGREENNTDLKTRALILIVGFVLIIGGAITITTYILYRKRRLSGQRSFGRGGRSLSVSYPSYTTTTSRGTTEGF